MTGKVIDSSIVAKYVLKEKGWKDLEELLLERPYTLELAFKETANAIWKRLTLLRDINVDTAKMMLRNLMDLRNVLRVEPQGKYLARAFDIAVSYNITVYDSLFIAQALVKKTTLITADKLQYDVATRMKLNAVLIQ